MKTVFRLFLLLIVFSCNILVLSAQENNHNQRVSREQLAQMQAMHIAQDLAFSDEEKTRFIDVFCKCQGEIWALGPRVKKRNSNMSEQDNAQVIQQRFDRSQKILDIRKKYYKEYSKFLTQAQIAKVYEKERQIKRRMAKRKADRSHKK